jgi:hypothetical protein
VTSIKQHHLTSIKQHNKKLISIKNVFEDALAQTPQPIEDGIKAAFGHCVFCP